MEHLDEISVDDLHDALASVKRKTSTQRLMVAISYKNGVTQTELAEWYNVERKTIYSWLMRFDTDEPLSDAATDSHRSGRKRKISETQQKEVEQTV